MPIGLLTNHQLFNVLAHLLRGDDLGVVEAALDPEDADGEVVPEAGEEDVDVLAALGAAAHPVPLEAQHHHVGRELKLWGK